MSYLETICPRYLTGFVANLHFKGCCSRFAFLRFVKSKSRWCKCSLKPLENTSTSSVYTRAILKFRF